MNARIRHRAVTVATLIAALAGAASFSVAMPAAASATTGAGGLALTWPAHASMSLPTGYQELLNAHTNKCADVADKSTEVGHVVHQWSCHRDDNQLWKVEGNVNGFMLRNLRS